MVKPISLANSTDELEEKAENVAIDESSDERTLLRYIKSANAVFVKAESVYKQGDEEQAYIYYVKYFHVFSQLRSSNEYIKKNKHIMEEMKRILPLHYCKKAIERAEKLKASLTYRYDELEALKLKAKRVEEDKRIEEEESARKLAELEKLKIEAEQPAVDAATLFSQTLFSTPLIPVGQSGKDIIPKEPFISAIELMHIIDAGIKVLLIDIRTLEEFKNSHMIHSALIFISKDYLDVNTKFKSAEFRELILIKDHKVLWDKRSSHDLIVVYDTDSFYHVTDQQPTHPINIVRECTTDILDPAFINSDLPKVLDGGYMSWVEHFPKHCTNPDRAKMKSSAPPKLRRSAPVPQTPVSKQSAIYPFLSAEDSQPKPIPLTKPPSPPPSPVLPRDMPPDTPAPVKPAPPDISPAIVTCGNVQINMPQSPQTIQINQWSQGQLNEYDHSSNRRTGGPEIPDQADNLQHSIVKRNASSLRITDVYEGDRQPAPSSAPQSSEIGLSSTVPDEQLTLREHAEKLQPKKETSSGEITTFPAKKPAEPVYAEVESIKKRIPSNIVQPSVKPPPTQYAQIQDIRPADNRPPEKRPTDNIPAVDRSIKPKFQKPALPSPGSSSSQMLQQTRLAPPTQLISTTQPMTSAQIPPTSPITNILSQPPHNSKLSPAISKQQFNQTPHNPTQLHNAPRPRATTPADLTQPPKQPPKPQGALPRPPHKPPINSTEPLSNPAKPPSNAANHPSTLTVNRVVKPLSAKAIEEKYMRMMPGYGSVQVGTCGLKNIGNTCFMNAVLQCLSAIAPLSQYFISGRHKQEINPDNPLGTQGLVAEEYAFLVKAMWSDKYRFLSPKDWKEAIGKFRPQFLDYSQKDCQEFTSFMLDALHEDLNRVSKDRRVKPREIDFSKMTYKEGGIAAWEMYKLQNDSIIVDLFQGQFRNVMRCMKCGYESVTFDTFMYLSVPVGSSKTQLKSCIEKFCQSEQLEWRCDKCKVYGDATKDITIWRLPIILVVILKRFSYTGMWRDKISTFVDFPTSNFRAVGREVDWVSNPEEGKIYRLFGVTNHTGTLEGGHYIGCARNPASGDWFTYDDHVIRPMRVDQTRKKEAYLLFYTSINEDDDIRLINKR